MTPSIYIKEYKTHRVRVGNNYKTIKAETLLKFDVSFYNIEGYSSGSYNILSMTPDNIKVQWNIRQLGSVPA